MPTRFVKGQARCESPRLKDLHVVATARDPSVGRSEGGRFAPGNPHAIGQGFKATIRKSLGTAADTPEGAEVSRNATKLYLAMLRELPSDGAQVRALVAGSCRHAALATHYANAAAAAGLSTPEGLKLAEASRAHDMTAQRLSVAAYDRAARVADEKKETADPHAALRAVVEAEGSK